MQQLSNLNECMMRFQGEKSIEIPAGVYNKIIKELEKYKFEGTFENLYYFQMTIIIKIILKKINKEIYYENIPYIIIKLLK